MALASFLCTQRHIVEIIELAVEDEVVEVRRRQRVTIADFLSVDVLIPIIARRSYQLRSQVFLNILQIAPRIGQDLDAFMVFRDVLSRSPIQTRSFLKTCLLLLGQRWRIVFISINSGFRALFFQLLLFLRLSNFRFRCLDVCAGVGTLD